MSWRKHDFLDAQLTNLHRLTLFKSITTLKIDLRANLSAINIEATVMTTFVLDPETDVIGSVPRPRPFQRRQYRDKQYKGGEAEWKKKLDESSTIYVGELSAYTNEYQLYELFSRCGSIKRIIMGLDKYKKTPCGFCFIEFDERESATKSINLLHKNLLDGRCISVNKDAGFQEGRQFGRGSHGGQIGDERRRESDPNASQPGTPRGLPGANILTRSITIVACITMISLILIAHQPEFAESAIAPSGRVRPSFSNRYSSVAVQIRQAQMKESREQFERNFAQFLVNILKSAKPTLLQAFMRATLADKELREEALGIFFNTTSNDN